MAKGLLLPSIHNNSKQHGNSDFKLTHTHSERSPLWHFSSMDHHFTVTQPPPGSTQATRSNFILNSDSTAHNPGEFRFRLERENYENKQPWSKDSSRDHTTAFIQNMSKEANEALKETRYEMAFEQEDIVDTASFENNRPSPTQIRYLPPINPAENNRLSPTQIRYLPPTNPAEKNRLSPTQIRHLAPINPAEKASPTRKKKIKRHKLTRQKLPPIESKAPYSYTAARLGRKNRPRSPKKDTDNMNIDLEVLRSRPFEITPQGYDSRYMVPLSVALLHSEDENTWSQVISRATEKCSYWLEHQRDDIS